MLQMLDESPNSDEFAISAACAASLARIRLSGGPNDSSVKIDI